MGRSRSPACPDCLTRPTQRLYIKTKGQNKQEGFAWHCPACECMWKQ